MAGSNQHIFSFQRLAVILLFVATTIEPHGAALEDLPAETSLLLPSIVVIEADADVLVNITLLWKRPYRLYGKRLQSHPQKARACIGFKEN